MMAISSAREMNNPPGTAKTVLHEEDLIVAELTRNCAAKGLRVQAMKIVFGHHQSASQKEPRVPVVSHNHVA
jgi:hypothetical protein